MEFSWIDELVSSEKVFGSHITDHVKRNLQTDKAEQIMNKMVDCKQEYLNIVNLWEESRNYKTFEAEQNATRLIRKHTIQRDKLYRELKVLLWGEENVRQDELRDEQKWKEINKEIIF